MSVTVKIGRNSALRTVVSTRADSVGQHWRRENQTTDDAETRRAATLVEPHTLLQGIAGIIHDNT